MSAQVTAEFFAQPGRGEEVAKLLLDVLGESLTFEGCEDIRILRDQNAPDHVTGLTQWTEAHNYTDYLAWRAEHGSTATFEGMLTRPLVIHYYDEIYHGQGIATPRDQV
ncbi:quinol monooxygenase YgiN [Kitasatospora sp. MAA19]|uniref:putative quinol monooxygenase n=1 Tax=Kitasatospora sp. MAA19 TaxID=3035090 RepID=UPI0024769C4E|nr:antibiotic biosynthesis monooxygenase [Kitasatospora sp. MAA19]MDH6707735.1 quinol monooxygenase YgiN [Kitasatospora sp. MAA19]